MKLLIVSDYFQSGNSRLLEDQTRELILSGHDVRLVAGHQDPNSTDTQPITGDFEPRIFRYNPNRSMVLEAPRFIRNLRSTLRDVLERFDPDATILHQPLSGFVTLRILPDLPSVYYFHSPWSRDWATQNPDPNGNLLNSVFRRIQLTTRRWLEHRVLKQVDRIVCLSHFMKNEALDVHPTLDPDRIRIIPGGVNLQRFRTANREPIRRKRDIEPETRILVTIRRLVPRMGLDLLLEAYDRLPEQSVPIKLLIGGKGPERNQLESRAERIEKPVQFLGYVPEEDIVDLYRLGDFFMVPTRSLEGFGLVTLEALACGTPVIATNRGGSPEILEPFDDELLLEGLDPSSWAQTIDRLLQSHRTSNHYRKYCREYVVKNFAWHDQIDRLESLLHSL